VLLTGSAPSVAFVSPAAAAGAVLLVVGPWLWRLALERDAERTARIRTDERADVAARVHDSVLQTLALIQRHAEEPRRVASLARRQERELRGWLYGSPGLDGDTLVAALAGAADEVEELHGVRIELASAGDCELSDGVRQLVLAAREAMTNAAKFSGSDEVAVYAEAGPSGISVFVRDRGAGFDRATVPPGRRGLAESIEGRMERAGGVATVTSEPGSGTEVELALPGTRG
jgi:signal transduction histidine kinase